MLRKVLLPAALIVTSFPDMPAAIPAAQAQTSGGQVCRNFAPNGSFYGYQADLNVDLAGSFSSIDEIYGVATTASGHNILLQKTSPAGSWIDQGYGPSAAGGQYYATGGWLTFNGNPSLPASTSGLDVRFGSADGISPGKTTVPTGTQALYMVDRGSTAISNFNLTVCGKPVSSPTCATATVDQANRWAPAARIPFSLPGAPAKVVSISSSNITVAAFGANPSEVQPINNPTGPGIPRTRKFPLALNNRDVLFFMVPKGYLASHPVDSWRAQAKQPYLTLGQPVVPGQYVSPVNSWGGPVGAPDTPAHGNVSGTVTICVQ